MKVEVRDSETHEVQAFTDASKWKIAGCSGTSLYVARRIGNWVTFADDPICWLTRLRDGGGGWPRSEEVGGGRPLYPPPARPGGALLRRRAGCLRQRRRKAQPARV